MRAVLISIKPRWCDLIMDGRKTVEIRTSRPKINTPFKCYIYCTFSGSKEFYKEKWNDKRGKVIGEFVCDNIIEDWTGGHNTALYRDAACLTVGEASAYCMRFPMYGWHISDLKIYDIPKELSEFRGYDSECLFYAMREYGCKDLDGKRCRACHLFSPPQSWRYVKELTEVQT